MYFTFTKHYERCGCDVPGREQSNGCSGNCTGDNIIYNETLDARISDYWLILCSLRNHSIDANKSIKDIADQVSPIVKGIIDFAEADYSKAAFIGLFLSAKKLYIIFDYDNPDYSDYRVIAFKVRRHIKPIFVPATEVHKQVKSWKSYLYIVCPLLLLKIV